MGYAQDLVNAGYIGYTAWSDREAEADFAATGGAGKTGGGGGGSTSSGFSPVSAADITSLEEQAYKMVAPYYLQLAKESAGDFERAKLALTEDYQKGTREARKQYAISSEAQNRSLENALGTFGINFNKEQESTIDDLNRRGMAVYQNGPGNTPNVVQQSAITANPDYSSTITNPVGGDLGRGGYELNQLEQGQKLRQEAIQRSTQANLNQLGLNLNKQVGSTSEGQLPSPTADRTEVGSLGLSYLRGNEDEARQQQLRNQALAERRTQDIQGIANQQAQIGSKSISEGQQNQYLRNQRTDFINNAV